jgi:hypothetical protein
VFWCIVLTTNLKILKPVPANSKTRHNSQNNPAQWFYFKVLSLTGHKISLKTDYFFSYTLQRKYSANTRLEFAKSQT